MIREFQQKISFVILSGGHRQRTLRELCAVLEDDPVFNKEIIVVGKDIQLSSPDIRVLERPDLADSGKICHMRNVAAEHSSGEILVLLDDDLVLQRDWFVHIIPLMQRLRDNSADIGTCRIVGPNGRRWYDWCWASRKDHTCPTMLLPYSSRSRELYVSGCCMIMRRDVWDTVRFDESLSYYQNDDIDFCHRATDVGYRFTCSTSAVATHLLLPAGRKQDDRIKIDKFSEAIWQYRNGNLKEALQLVQESRDSIDASIYNYYLGYFAFLLRNIPMAEEHLTSAIHSIDTESMRPLKAQALYRLGLVKLFKKSRSEAGKCFARVLELFPDHPFASFRIQRINDRHTQF